MSKEILIESIFPGNTDSSLLNERDDKGFLYLKGPLIKGEFKNLNGRIYPLSEIEKAINNINERIADLKKKSGNPMACIAGECDHPERT